MRRIAVLKADPQFSDFDRLKSRSKNLCRVLTAKLQCPIAAEKVIDDLRHTFEAKRKFFAVDGFKLNAAAVKQCAALLYFLVCVRGAQACLHAENKAVAFVNPVAVQKLSYKQPPTCEAENVLWRFSFPDGVFRRGPTANIDVNTALLLTLGSIEPASLHITVGAR